jgi:hypothetical protein
MEATYSKALSCFAGRVQCEVLQIASRSRNENIALVPEYCVRMQTSSPRVLFLTTPARSRPQPAARAITSKSGVEMKMSVKALAIAGGALWGGALLATGLINLKSSRYGKPFLELMASVYPGYHACRNVSDVLVGALYAAGDGALCGAAFGALYNAAAGCRSEQRT